MKILFSTLFILLSLFSYAQNPAAEQIGNAIKLMDEGHFSESRAILEEVLLDDSTNYDAWYEYAYSFYIQKDYAKAVEIMRKQTTHPEVTDQLWQIIGNSLDYSGDPDGALAAYAEGLQKFPHSGRLYVETGNIYLNQNNIEKAIQSYEKGIEMAPEFSSNYFRLAKLFCGTEDEIWGVLYGEIFMNLERNSQRTREMSALLYQTYLKALFFDKGKIIISFSQDMAPFTMAFEKNIGLAASKYLIDQKKVANNIETFVAVRRYFLSQWFTDEQAKAYPVALFDFWQQIDDLGFTEPYLYWIFNQAPSNQFEKWHKTHEQDFTFFTKWFNPNPIQIDSSNYLHRTKLLN
ncbi:MAG: tetratricopeptide repeat protein [Flavobacteriales bacterium]